MGWDETEFSLQDAVDTCTNLDGQIESCPLFKIISEAEQQRCQFDLPSTLKEEDCKGPLKSLPGNVDLSWGPAPANGGAKGSAASASVAQTTVLSTLSYSAGSTASVNGSYELGNIFKATPTVGDAQISGTPAATTPGATITPAATVADDPYDPLITLATSRYTYTGADGDVTISAIVYEEAIAWVTEMTTTTVYVEPTGVARRDAHAHRHRKARGHFH